MFSINQRNCKLGISNKREYYKKFSRVVCFAVEDVTEKKRELGGDGVTGVVEDTLDDGSYYFDEKLLDASRNRGPLSAISSVVRGLTTFATSTSANLNLPGDKILGLANFFLGIGVPGNPHQAFLKLIHETKFEHIFIVGSSGKQFTVVLDFLGLVEKFFSLSGRYDIQLTIGDSWLGRHMFSNLWLLKML